MLNRIHVIVSRTASAVMVIIIFFVALDTLRAQPQKIAVADIDSLLHQDEMYMYMGNGTFFGFRSCRMKWIGVDYQDITLYRSDSLLRIAGKIYNTNPSYIDSLLNIQLLVGRLCDNPAGLSIRNLSLDYQQRYLIDSTGVFDFTIRFSPHDAFCFTTSEPIPDIHRESASVVILDVGKLLK
jgi:hypothetical protein